MSDYYSAIELFGTDADRARTRSSHPSCGWRILRSGATFTTVGRTATTYENGMLVGCERQQLTVFDNGDILFYYHDDLAAEQGYPVGWQRLRFTDSILTVISQRARTDYVEY